MSKTLQLFWGSGSPFARRVQIYLLEKGIDFESKLLQFSNKEHKTEEFLKMNPRGKVPLLVDNSSSEPIYVYESLAILKYLEHKYGPLSQPENDRELASTLIRAHEVDPFFHSGVGPFTQLASLWFKKEDEWDLPALKQALDSIVTELKIWNNLCADGNFINATKNFSLADAVFFPSLALIERLGLDFQEFGLDNLVVYLNTLNERQSIKESIPPHWVGTTNSKYPILKQKLAEANL